MAISKINQGAWQEVVNQGAWQETGPGDPVVINPDFLHSSVPGTELFGVGEGDQCLLTTVLNATDKKDAYIYQDKENIPINYVHGWKNIGAIGFTAAGFKTLMLTDSSGNEAASIEYRYNGGNLQWAFNYYSVSALQTTDWTTISEETWWRFQYLYDITNDVWMVRAGAFVAGGGTQVDSVQFSGSLSANTRTPYTLTDGTFDHQGASQTDLYTDLTFWGVEGWKVETPYSITSTDGAVLGDSVTVIGDFQHGSTDEVVLGDSVTTTGPWYKTATDGVVLGDAASAEHVGSNVATAGIILGDSAVAPGVFPKTATDGVILGDVATSELKTDSVATDGVVLGDSPSVVGDFVHTATDGVVLGDSPNARNATHHSVSSDGVVLGDSVVGEVTGAEFGNALDGIVLGDICSAALVSDAVGRTGNLRLLGVGM